jgi:resuscitation-promoting factor RpfB
MAIKASYLLLTGAGAVVVYSGVKGKGLSSALRSVISGNKPSSATTANAITPATYGYGVTDTAAAAGVTAPQEAGSTGNAKANQAIGRVLAAAYGWGTGNQWQSLVDLWNQESGWNQYAYNASSGATGIPQSLPYTKMPKAAWLASQGGSASVVAQIGWGLSYIKSRYGSPAAAWAHEVAYGWY